MIAFLLLTIPIVYTVYNIPSPEHTLPEPYEGSLNFVLIYLFFIICRFLEEYKQEGIEVWGVTGGNEAMMMLGIPKQTIFNLTASSPMDQRGWLRKYLKPLLISNGFSDVKFITLEDERLFIPYWMERVSIVFTTLQGQCYILSIKSFAINVNKICIQDYQLSCFGVK